MNMMKMKDKNRLITNFFRGCGDSAGIVTSAWSASRQKTRVRFKPEPVDGEFDNSQDSGDLIVPHDHTVQNRADKLQTICD